MTEITAEERRKTYPAMKDSGVPWLGETPSHWKTERAKWLFRKMELPVRENDEVVTCFRDGAVTLRKNRRLRGFTESLKEIGYQGIRRGDLVIHAMDAFAGAVGVSDSDGKGTPVYSVCSPRQSANAYYYAFCVREMARSEWILALAKGIRERSTDFRFTDFASQRVPLPPLPEQAAIVRFLDHADRRIRRYIRAKQKLIALLEEQKQAIIHRAITRGLDPNVRFKSSGVEWFPEVPDHWNVLPMRRVIYSAVDGPHFSPSYLDTGIPFLSARNIRSDGWSLEDAKYISEDDYDAFNRRVKPVRGDVLYTKGGTTGVARVVDLSFPFQVWVHIAVLKVNKNAIDPEFLAAALNSTRCYEQSQLFTRGATNQDLGLGRMKGIEVPVPPALREQQAIVRYLRTSLRQALDGVSTTNREIDLLREYRARLTADIVTGKLDVREAATRLPDEVDEVQSLNEAETLADGREAPTDALGAALEEAAV